MPAQGFGEKPRFWMGSSLSPPPVTLGESSPLPGPPGFFVQCRVHTAGCTLLGTAQRELEAVAVLAALVRDPPTLTLRGQLDGRYLQRAQHLNSHKIPFPPLLWVQDFFFF